MTRKAIARVCNILQVLSVHFVPISDNILANAYDRALEHESEFGVKGLLRDCVAEALVIAVSADILSACGFRDVVHE